MSGAALSKLQRISPALDRVSELIQRIAEQGFQRATAATVGDLQRGAQIAHHARLVRIERELEGLATQVDRYLRRDPEGRPRQMMEAANRIWLLVAQTRDGLRDATDPADLEAVAGVLRRTYAPVDGPVDVVPVSASGWVTESGFAGVTVDLWSADHGPMSASMVRPVDLVGGDPRRLLRTVVSDATPTTVHALCHGSWTLYGVRLSSDKRLSLHGGLMIEPAAPPGRAVLAAMQVGSAEEILDQLQERQLDPISGLGSILAYVEPIAFGAVEIDEVRARGTARLTDGSGARLGVAVPVRPEHDVLIDNLEVLGEGSWAPDGLIVSARVIAGGLSVQPRTAVFGDGVGHGKRIGRSPWVHLTLEALSGIRR